jgi:uncharacterized protein (DUF58 family)
MTLMLVVDVSGSEDFGTGQYFKGEVIAHLAALLSFSAAKNKDPVGLLLYSDQVEHYVPPKKGRGQVHRILRDLFYFKPKSRGTRLASALEYLSGVQKKKSHTFIFSDFYDQNFDGELRLLSRKHDVVAVVVNDSMELSLPDVGLVDMEDSETGEIFTVDTSSRSYRQAVEVWTTARKERRDAELRRSGVERIDVRSDQDYVQPLIRFFKMRNRR